jgi:hypothetical protein
MVGSHKGKCGLHDSCCFKVIFSKERKNNGKQSGGNQFSVAMDPSIFDHSITCSALGASSKQLTKSMVYNSALANSMLTFCKNVNAPEIMQAVEREQGAAAGLARTTRRWLCDMAEPMSMIDPELPAEHDYNFLQTYSTAFETLNPGSIAKIYTTEVNNEERFDGFCVCFQPQIQRIQKNEILLVTPKVCSVCLSIKLQPHALTVSDTLKHQALTPYCVVRSTLTLEHYTDTVQAYTNRLNISYTNGLNISFLQSI